MVMAMIICPECGKKISDKAASCPNCGFPLDFEDLDVEAVDVEIGDGYNRSLEKHNGNGQYSLNVSEQMEEETYRGLKQKNKQKKIIIGVIIGFIALTGIVAGTITVTRIAKIREQQEAEIAAVNSYNAYIDKYNELYSTLLNGGSEAESVCVLTYNVWNNSIFDRSSEETAKYVAGTSDFNEAIENVYGDEAVIIKLMAVAQAQKKADSLIKELQSSPYELEKCYDAAIDANVMFNSLADLALSPSGNLTSYGEAEGEKVAGFVNAYNTFEALIPEKKEVPDFGNKSTKTASGKIEESSKKESQKNELSFADYLNKSASELPESVDDKYAQAGAWKETKEIGGLTGEVTYWTEEDLDKIYSILWTAEYKEKDDLQKVLKVLKEKYGDKPNASGDSYQWETDAGGYVMLKDKGTEMAISWITAD